MELMSNVDRRGIKIGLCRLCQDRRNGENNYQCHLEIIYSRIYTHYLAKELQIFIHIEVRWRVNRNLHNLLFKINAYNLI